MVCTPEPVSIFCSSICIITGTAVVGNGCKVIIITTAGITIGTGFGISAGIVGGAGCTLRSCRATR